MDSSVKKGGAQPLSYTNTTITEPAALPGGPLLYSAGTIARPEILQKGGLGQPLSYVNTSITEPAALPGAPLLYSRGVIARPEIVQTGGQQPLSYTNTNVYEPAALPGAPLLYSEGTVARPEIGMKGGFHPSIMGNLVENARLLVPLAATAAYRLYDNQTRKRGGALGDFESYRLAAKDDLNRIAPGRANARWIQKLAATRRRGQDNTALLKEFAEAKKVSDFDTGLLKVPRKVIALPKSPEQVKETPQAFVNPQSKWEYERKQAKEELTKVYAKPTATNIVKYATLKRTGNKAALDEFISQLTTRAQEKKAKAAPKPIVPEVSRVTGRVVKPTEKAKDFVVKQTKAEIEKEAIANTRPWEQIRADAKEELTKIGKAPVTNINKLAKMMKYGDGKKISAFLDEFREKKAAQAAKKGKTEPKGVVVQAAPKDLPPVVLERKPQEPTRKKKQVHFTPEQKNWEQYRSGAARMLEGIGGIGATAAEISELAKKIKAGEDVRTFLDQYEGRVKETAIRKERLAREKAEREEQDRRDRERRQREHNESKWAEDEEESKEEDYEPPKTVQQRDYRYEPLGSTETTPERTPPLGWPYTPPKREERKPFRQEETRPVVDEYTPPAQREVKPLPQQMYRGPIVQPTAAPPRPPIKQYGKFPGKVAVAPVQADKYKAMIADLDKMLGKVPQ